MKTVVAILVLVLWGPVVCLGLFLLGWSYLHFDVLWDHRGMILFGTGCVVAALLGLAWAMQDYAIGDPD